MSAMDYGKERKDETKEESVSVDEGHNPYRYRIGDKDWLSSILRLQLHRIEEIMIYKLIKFLQLFN